MFCQNEPRPLVGEFVKKKKRRKESKSEKAKLWGELRLYLSAPFFAVKGFL